MSRLTRSIGAILVATTFVSTGVAAAFSEENKVITGHTSFYRAVLTSADVGGPVTPPVDYGLSTQRGTYLLGMMESSRPLDERDNRMVFAWNSAHPDPTKSASLSPTGDFARVRDRYDAVWTVYEFRYGGVGRFGEPLIHHAYGVRIGTLHYADPDQPLPPGIDGSYNWAITYRLDRLFPEHFERTPAGFVAIPDPPVSSPLPAPTLSAVLGARDPAVRDFHPEPRSAPLEVSFGLGKVPMSIRHADPAEASSIQKLSR